MRRGLSKRDFSKLALASAVVPPVLPGNIQAEGTGGAVDDAAPFSPDIANHETARWCPSLNYFCEIWTCPLPPTVTDFGYG